MVKLTLLPLNLINLAKVIPPRNACIYFLFLHDELVYIGQTKELGLRLEWHTSHTPFTHYRALIAPWNNKLRGRLERAYIYHYQPLYNEVGKRLPLRCDWQD